MAKPRLRSGILLEELPWDSQHFGFRVAQIPFAELGQAEMAGILHRAVQQGIRLVYWAAHPDQQVPASLLRDFSGTLVDCKATYVASLPTQRRRDDRATTTVSIDEYPCGPASEVLVDLAIESGRHSRFRVDGRIPRDRCERLFEIWMQRSTHREVADMVLVARSPGQTPVTGMVTVSVTDGVGRVGLIAVAEALRGQGVGLQLMQAAERWMVTQRAARATVVTQQTNTPACRLYERAGYHLTDVKHYYHFWVPEGPSRRQAA